MRQSPIAWTALCAALPLTWIAAGRATPDVVRAGAFEVVDDEGRVRVRIGAGTDDEPSIAVFDAQGRIASSVTVAGEGGFRQVTLRTHRIDGSSSVELYDEEGGNHGAVRQLRFLGELGEDTIVLGHGLMELGSSLSFSGWGNGSRIHLGLDMGLVPSLRLKQGRVPEAVHELRADGVLTEQRLEPQIVLEKDGGARTITID